MVRFLESLDSSKSSQMFTASVTSIHFTHVFAPISFFFSSFLLLSILFCFFISFFLLHFMNCEDHLLLIFAFQSTKAGIGKGRRWVWVSNGHGQVDDDDTVLHQGGAKERAVDVQCLKY